MSIVERLFGLLRSTDVDAAWVGGISSLAELDVMVIGQRYKIQEPINFWSERTAVGPERTALMVREDSTYSQRFVALEFRRCILQLEVESRRFRRGESPGCFPIILKEQVVEMKRPAGR